MASISPGENVLAAATLRRVSWRLLPFLILAYVVAYVDRVNAGFAALQMNKDIGLSSTVFGLGGGIFFISYFLCEVPSNLVLEKVGARRWIARIMITWGIVSGLMALAAGPKSFVLIRFLLGAAEAGFFPGVILYLTYWFPAERRAHIVGLFMVAIPVAGVIGSPISGLLLGLNGLLGLRGWQWLFILEAAPAVLLGFICLFWLTDRPEHASWLAPEQRAWLASRLAEERAQAKRVAYLSLWQVLRNRHVLTLAVVYIGMATSSSGLALWQPQFLKSFGLTNIQTGFLNAIPYVLAAIAMVIWARRSDRSGERIWHIAAPLAMCALGLLLCIWLTTLGATMVLLSLATMGTSATRGPFWALSSEWLSAPVAAAGIAHINAIGTGCGFVTILLMGTIKDATESYPLALLPIVAFTAIGTVAVLVIARQRVSSGRLRRLEEGVG